MKKSHKRGISKKDNSEQLEKCMCFSDKKKKIRLMQKKCNNEKWYNILGKHETIHDWEWF